MNETNNISSFHEVKDGIIELKRPIKNYMPAGYEYIIVFQETLEKVLTYDLNKTEMKVFVFILSQVGFENNLIMPGLQSLCAFKINDYKTNVSNAFKKLHELNIIIKEPIEFTKSFKYRINYELCAKDKGLEIKDKRNRDKKNNPINENQTNMFNEYKNF